MIPQARTASADRRLSRRIPRVRGVRRQTFVGWLFVLPALVMYGLFVLQPLALTVQYSFYRWDGVGPATWVGLSNYVAMLTEPRLVETLFNAFRLVLFFSVVPVALGLVTASVIHRVARGRFGAVSRTVLFLPQVIPLVAAGIIWGGFCHCPASSTRAWPQSGWVIWREPGSVTSTPRCRPSG